MMATVITGSPVIGEEGIESSFHRDGFILMVGGGIREENPNFRV
jgi:hypothetical protein